MENQKMSDDEQAIRQLVETWFAATKNGDTKTILSLMSDDVIFSVAGQEPFGKEAFEAAANEQKNMDIDGTYELKEIKILGDWAYIRSFIKIKMSIKGGEPINRSGYTLSILQKVSDGKWRIVRDANLLTVDK